MKCMLGAAIVAAALLTGCAQRNTGAAQGTEQRVAEIARVYEKEFAGNPNRQVRKPRVDARNRAMRELAELAAVELASAPQTQGDAKLASDAASPSTPAAEFHAALAALQAAAEHREESAVRREYARVIEAHAKLAEAETH
ncbi:MAG: hypothetical protein JNG88_02580 [Phycisphaerales bacterium]|nr:hypothetical protein [Phycisphaerales bacterium]